MSLNASLTCRLLSAAHSEVPRQHPAASVPGDVPHERGQRGDVPDRHEEHVQSQTGRSQEVRPEGEETLHANPDLSVHTSSFMSQVYFRRRDVKSENRKQRVHFY